MEKEIKSNQKLLTWMRLNVSIQFKAKYMKERLSKWLTLSSDPDSTYDMCL